MSKRKAEDEFKDVVQKSVKRAKKAQNNGKGPLRFYKWLVTNKNGLYGTDVADWKLENSGPWGYDLFEDKNRLFPRPNDPEEAFDWFPGEYRRSDGMACHFRVKLDEHQLDYIEKKGKRVKDAVQGATGIHQEPLLALVLDYSAPSLVWISYQFEHYNTLRRYEARVVHCSSLEEANNVRGGFMSIANVVKWRPPRIFEMVLNPRTLVVSGPKPRAPPRKRKKF